MSGLSDRAAWLLSYASEFATASAFVCGWILVTSGVAALTTKHLWPISIGLLLISLGGWRLLRTLVTEGLYSLTRNVKTRE